MPRVIVTIDTEIGEVGRYLENSFEYFIEGKVDGREIGYRSIIDKLNEYGGAGEFFVDVYPYRKLGERKFSDLCKTILDRGHNVQLHTHPAMAFDEKRPNLHQYSLNEQIEVIEHGLEKIVEWSGSKPIAHRAGMYGINKDTFAALAEASIFYDCSYFHGHENCHFQSNIINKPFKIGKVTELPVTVFARIDRADALPLRKKNPKNDDTGIHDNRVDLYKIDYRSGADVGEITQVLDQSDRNTIVILFLHSFNFLQIRYNYRTKTVRSIKKDKNSIESFEKILKWISKSNSCSFETIDSVNVDYEQKDYCVRVLKDNKRNFRKLLKERLQARVLHIEEI